jgi:hypothetical protein
MLGNATRNTRHLARKSRTTVWTIRELEHWLLHLHTICSSEKRNLDSLQESLFYLYRRYGSMATLWVARVSAIVNFIARHRASLIRDGHITRSATAETLSDNLKHALATLPITNPATGFSYRRVHSHIQSQI